MHNILRARFRSTVSPSNEARNAQTQRQNKMHSMAAVNEQKIYSVLSRERFISFLICLLILYLLKYNQHFKAFLVSKFNSETSFLYQLFKENSNFIVTEPCKVICNSICYDFHYYLYLCIYTPSYPHFKAFPVSKFNSETSFLYQLFKENSNDIVVKPCAS